MLFIKIYNIFNSLIFNGTSSSLHPGFQITHISVPRKPLKALDGTNTSFFEVSYILIKVVVWDNFRSFLKSVAELQ